MYQTLAVVALTPSKHKLLCAFLQDKIQFNNIPVVPLVWSSSVDSYTLTNEYVNLSWKKQPHNLLVNNNNNHDSYTAWNQIAVLEHWFALMAH